jgi:hypothetical protein
MAAPSVFEWRGRSRPIKNQINSPHHPRHNTLMQPTIPVDVRNQQYNNEDVFNSRAMMRERAPAAPQISLVRVISHCAM